jgi:N-acetylglucosamine-6-sulfatase
MGNDNTRRPGWDYWVSLKGQGEAENPMLNINGEEQLVPGYVTDILTDHSLKFIRQQREKPFLLYLSHKALHPNVIQRNDGSVVDIGGGGFVAAPRHKGMYDGKTFARRPNHGIAPLDKPALARQIDDLPPLGPETATKEKTIQERAEMLMAVDEGLGILMKELEAQSELDNTIIVFTSDHGFWYGEHGLDEERRLAYEESIRIPVLIRYPPLIKAGFVSENMILSIDLAPTLIEIAGLKAGTNLQGRSLLPLFNSTAKDWRTSFLIEYYSDSVFPRIRNMGYKAVRTNRYKYIRYLELAEMDELYDLRQDPYELKNIINDPNAAEVLGQMKSELNSQLIKTGYQK